MASAFQVRRACHILHRGGIIIYPTDTIYGIGCDPHDRLAVTEVFRVKRRPANKNMILLAADMKQLEGIASEPSAISECDTPTTWIMPAADNCPDWLRADDGTVAVRVTSHPIVSALCLKLGSAIISTSANISGRAPVRNGLDMHRQFHGMVDAIIVDDSHSTGRASTIRHLSTNETVRSS